MISMFSWTDPVLVQIPVHRTESLDWIDGHHHVNNNYLYIYYNTEKCNITSMHAFNWFPVELSPTELQVKLFKI